MKSKYQLITEGLTMQIQHRAILTEDWDICLCESKVTGRRVFAVLPAWLVGSTKNIEMSLHYFLKCSAALVFAPSPVLSDSQCHELMTGVLNSNTHDRFSLNLQKWHAIGLVQDAWEGEVWHRTEPMNFRLGIGKFS